MKNLTLAITASILTFSTSAFAEMNPDQESRVAGYALGGCVGVAAGAGWATYMLGKNGKTVRNVAMGACPVGAVAYGAAAASAPENHPDPQDLASPEEANSEE
jgi:hypothetical protein